MLSSKEPKGSPSLRKYEPKARLPVADALATFSSADRSLLERRVAEKSECIYCSIFEREGAEQILLAPPPETSDHGATPANSDDSGANFLLGDDQQALLIDQERHVFLRFNYARHRVMQILESCQARRLTADAARELLKWESLVVDTRNELVRMNVPLVLAMVKRTKITGVDYADLISEGSLALMRSVDKFDCARGFKFSTYACRAILKAFARVATRTARYRGHFPTEFDPALERGDAVDRKRADVTDDCVDELKHILGSNQAHLNPVEQTVIKARFAIAGGDDPAPEDAQTLEQVGHMIGVTKERVRQIQNKALLKLRSVLEEGVLAVKAAN